MPSFLISLSLVATYILFLFFFFLESDTSKLNSEIGNSQISPKDEEFVSSCMNGDIRKVKTMIESGQNVNICLQSGMTPLTLSYRKKKFEVFEILVKFGADINISNIGLQNSPSFYILKNLNPDLDFSYKCFEKILNSGLNVNLSDKNDVLICVASQCSDIRFLMALVAKGANIGVIDGRGDTPIESAIRVMNFDAVQFLLSKGAKYEKEKVVRLIEKLKSKNRMNSKNLRALKKIESRLKIL